MAETERGVRFTLRTATAEDYRTPFGKIGEEIDRLEARFKGLTLPTGMFDALTAASTRSVTVVRDAEAAKFKAKTDNLKAMQAWEDKQTQFEERAAERRAKLGTKFDRDRQKEKEKEVAETAKAAEAEKKRQDDLAKYRADVRVKSNELARREEDRVAREAAAAARRRQAEQQETTRQGIDGAMQLGRAFALAGLIGQEDFGKVRDTILGVQSAIDAVRGGIDVYRAARGVGGTAVGATSTAGGAAAAAATAGAVAPALASLGPFAIAVGAATVAILGLKRGLDAYDTYDKRRQRADAANNIPGTLLATQYGLGGGPNSLLGLGIGGIQGGEDPAKATGEPPSRFGETARAILHMMSFGLVEAPDQAAGEAARAGAARVSVLQQLRDRRRAAPRIQEFQERQAREEQREEGRRLQQEQREHVTQQANEAAFRAFGVDPDLAARAADIRSRRALQEGRLQSRQRTLGGVRSEMGQIAKAAAEGGPDAAQQQARLEAMLQRERNLVREITDLRREGYELDRQGREATLEGLRQRAALEKAAYTGRRSDQAKFGDLDPFQQQMVAGLIRKAKAGTLEKYERRLLSGYGFKETEAALERQAIAEADRVAPGLFTRGAEQERAERQYHAEREITPETREAVTQAGGAFAVTATGDLRIVLDFDKNLADQFTESIRPDLENIATDIKEGVAAAIAAAQRLAEQTREQARQDTRKAIEDNNAKQNATNRQPAIP